MIDAAMDRQVLLFLPGLDGTGRLLYRQARLWDTYRVVCASYPADDDQSYERLAAVTAEHLEQASGGRPGIVLAESFGGAVALTLALSRPELVERMVLVNTFACFPGRLAIRLLASISNFLPNKPAHPATRRLRGPFFFSPDLTARDLNEWWERTRDVTMRAMGVRLSMIAKLDLRPRLHEIRIPTLVVTATDDRVVPAAAGRELARRMPCARLIEIRGRHAALIHPSVDVAALLARPEYPGIKLATQARALHTAMN